jgi:hypothetical protein
VKFVDIFRKPMMDQSIANAFQTLTTPLIADAILRLQLPVRAAPPGIQPVVPSQRVAGEIRDKERRQAALMRRGSSLRHQLRFDQYTQLRQTDRAYTFRQHLSKVDGAVE